jgi:hypothetical protein
MLKHLENERFELFETIALLNTLFPPALKEVDLPLPELVTVREHLSFRGALIRSIGSIAVEGDYSGVQRLLRDISRSPLNTWWAARRSIKAFVGRSDNLIRAVRPIANWATMIRYVESAEFANLGTPAAYKVVSRPVEFDIEEFVHPAFRTPTMGTPAVQMRGDGQGAVESFFTPMTSSRGTGSRNITGESVANRPPQPEFVVVRSPLGQQRPNINSTACSSNPVKAALIDTTTRDVINRSTCSTCDHFCIGRSGKSNNGSCKNQCGHQCRANKGKSVVESSEIGVALSTPFGSPPVAIGASQPNPLSTPPRFDAGVSWKNVKLPKISTASNTSVGPVSNVGNAPSLDQASERKLAALRVKKGHNPNPNQAQLEVDDCIRVVSSDPEVLRGLTPRTLPASKPSKGSKQSTEAGMANDMAQAHGDHAESFLIRPFPPEIPDNELNNPGYDILRDSYTPQEGLFRRNEDMRTKAIQKALADRARRDSEPTITEENEENDEGGDDMELAQPEEPKTALNKIFTSLGKTYSSR